MRILFIDPSRWQYTVDAPYERPLGGSQSALCYLAAELAQLGHAGTLINGVTAESESRGVRQRNLEALGASGFSDSFDVGIVLNLACGHNLRRDLNVKIPLILWNQHAHDQDAIQKLSRSREQREWSAFAFVSDWQRGCFEKFFSLPSGKTKVMRNAVSPAFAKFLKVDPWFMTGGVPVLFYTSTPFRGLDVLLDCFPRIRQSVPDVRLRIFSSMQVYRSRPRQIVTASSMRPREIWPAWNTLVQSAKRSWRKSWCGWPPSPTRRLSPRHPASP